jgi:hypothetical protein
MKLNRPGIRFPIGLPALVVVAALATSPAAAITIGQVDDFQGTTTQDWLGANPENVPDAGPNGAGDNALSAMANGRPFGASGKLLVFNDTIRWTGDWTSEGVRQVVFDVRNPNDFALSMRVAIAGADGFGSEGSGDTYVSTNPISVAADNAWHSIAFDVLADDFTSLGGADINAALADVTHFRILHNPAVSFLGEAVEADFFVDNIRALGAMVTVAGDYNGDDEVDAADYVIWRKTLNQSVTPGTGADGTGPGGTPDGVVNSLDYDFWRTHFGNTSGGGHSHALATGVVSVPEPATPLFLAWIAALAAGYHRRRRRGDC